MHLLHRTIIGQYRAIGINLAIYTLYSLLYPNVTLEPTLYYHVGYCKGMLA